MDKVVLDNLFTGKAHKTKYHATNPVSRTLVRNFMQQILNTVKETGSKDVFEVGCGEGHILGLLAIHGLKPRGCDISESSLAVASQEIEQRSLTIPVQNKDIYTLSPEQDSCDTVVCCEVLEHLTDPDKALDKLLSITKKDLIVSVPREPIWCLLNIVRGKYLEALGNTPGHYQHWSKKSFTQLIEAKADIISVKSPLPWTLIHCRPRNNLG